MNHATTWIVSFALGAAVAAIAWRAHALTVSGSVAAALVGASATHAGWSWAVILVAYFMSALLISRFRSTQKAARLDTRIAKLGPRDAAQVAANGGVFALATLGYSANPGVVWQALGAAALAASAADTWATEIGTLARTRPRSIINWRPVEIGTSGGVTAQGSLAGAAGTAFIAATTLAVRWPTAALAATLVGGVVGCIVDSVVGASLQARRWCATCQVATELSIHRCGSMTDVTGGLRFLDNDGVNAISTICGAVLGAASARYFA